MPTELPAVGFTDFMLTLNEYKSGFEPFGGSRVVQNFNSGKSDHWSGTITTRTLNKAEQRALGVWARSVGVYGQISVYHLDQPYPSTYVAGTVLAGDSSILAGSESVNAGNGSFPGSANVDGADQTGLTLNTKNWEASSAILGAGDFFGLNGHLYQLTEDVASDGSGDATLTFAQALHNSPADGDGIVTFYPKMTAYLQTQIQVQTDFRGLGQPVTFAFEEVI